MLDNTVFSLLTFLQINDNVHIVDKMISDSEEILIDEAKRRKKENDSYMFLVMRYKIDGVRIL